MSGPIRHARATSNRCSGFGRYGDQTGDGHSPVYEALTPVQLWYWEDIHRANNKHAMASRVVLTGRTVENFIMVARLL